MTSPKLRIAALALTGLLATGLAHAGGSSVQWSVSIGTPYGLVLQGQSAPFYGYGPAYGPVYYAPPPVYVKVKPKVFYVPQPVYVKPRDQRRYWHPVARWDRDGDGIPNRYDRVYNPRGDRDRDGIPDRRDRRDRPGR
jgi:hypothetical protein